MNTIIFFAYGRSFSCTALTFRFLAASSWKNSFTRFWVPVRRFRPFSCPLYLEYHRKVRPISPWLVGEGGACGVIGLIFAGYVLLASQNHYPIIVYSVANYRPHLSHFWANMKFSPSQLCHFLFMYLRYIEWTALYFSLQYKILVQLLTVIIMEELSYP